MNNRKREMIFSEVWQAGEHVYLTGIFLFFTNDCLFLAYSIIVCGVSSDERKKRNHKIKERRVFLMLYNEMNEQRMLNDAWGNFFNAINQLDMYKTK